MGRPAFLSLRVSMSGAAAERVWARTRLDGLEQQTSDHIFGRSHAGDAQDLGHRACTVDDRLGKQPLAPVTRTVRLEESVLGKLGAPCEHSRDDRRVQGAIVVTAET